MISKLCLKSYSRYISLPILGSILDEFTTWSYRRGYNIWTIRHQLRYSRKMDHFFRRRGIQHLCNLTHATFEAAWHYYHQRYPEITGTIRQIEQFLDETHRLAPLPQEPVTLIKSKLNPFIDYLRDVHGFTTSTLKLYDSYLQNFLKYIGYDRNTKVLTKISSKKIEGFIQVCSKTLNRYSIQHIVGYLRRFLKFQYDQGLLPRALHTEIDTPRIYRLEKLPDSISWDTVKALLHSIDRTTPDGIRDYAILFLIATYGLRPSELSPPKGRGI